MRYTAPSCIDNHCHTLYCSAIHNMYHITQPTNMNRRVLKLPCISCSSHYYLLMYNTAVPCIKHHISCELHRTVMHHTALTCITQNYHVSHSNIMNHKALKLPCNNVTQHFHAFDSTTRHHT